MEKSLAYRPSLLIHCERWERIGSVVRVHRCSLDMPGMEIASAPTWRGDGHEIARAIAALPNALQALIGVLRCGALPPRVAHQCRVALLMAGVPPEDLPS